MIIVLYRDNWHETEIARIKSVYKYRSKIESLLRSLNKKYFGYGYFTYKEIYKPGKCY